LQWAVCNVLFLGFGGYGFSYPIENFGM